ncbi:glycosyltransferase [Pseudonocardia alaniniphila]|uniref:Glycosyltransferase n=1 Tax=Pseudonocardia alaniniphila TaxID=75291 RepID=A0ABS9TAE5_9PSEU|nr:glycosyltransferase [Pseudonocardia alaniniphila]MCH6165510.1 glycosyltransferase [Pseudonocardia alaniniphila]
MRIAMVSDHASPLAALSGTDAGGQNVHVLELSSALAAMGHEVTVWTRRDDPSLPDTVPLRPGVVVRHASAGPAESLPKDELVPHLPAFTDTVKAAWATDRPDVVHAHYWMSGMVALAAAGGRIPVVETFHALGSVTRRHQGSEDTSPEGRIRAELAVARAVDRVLATCTDEVFELARLGAPRRRISVVPCGVDTELFAPEGPVAQRSERPRLLSLGRMVRHKGVDEVIEALRRIPHAELVVAGGAHSDDPYAERLRSHAEAVGVADRVRLIGPVGRDEVPALLRSADAVVCVPWYEPFGIVPLEAMACARPVVASAVGGIQDTVVDQVTGLLVPPRRPDAVAAAVRDLLASPTRGAAFGIAGHDRVLARYDWERVAAATAVVYEEVIEVRNGRVRAAADPEPDVDGAEMDGAEMDGTKTAGAGR